MSGVILGWPLASATKRGVGFIGEAAPTRPDRRRHERPISDASESHTLVVAPTGSGKGRGIVLPNLLTWPHSAIVVDIKGEAALTTARHRRALGQRVVVLDPFKRVAQGEEGLNPMDWLAGDAEHLGDNATTLAETLNGGQVSLKDPFWDHAAADLIAGLIGFAATRRGDERTLGHVYNLLTSDNPAYQIANLLDTHKDMHPFARRHLAAYCNHEAEKVRTSVTSTAQQHLRIFASPLVQRSVARTTMDLEALKRGEPVTVYLVLPAARLISHAPLLRIWLSVLLGTIAEREHKPLAPTLLIVDELAQIGAIPLILQALTLLRGYGLRVMAIIQSLAQLRALWPNDYQTIVDNCGTVVGFGLSRAALATPLAELLGDVSADTLMKLPAEHAIVSRIGHGSVIARRLDYLKDPLFAARFDPNPFYAGETPPPAPPAPAGLG